MTPSSPCPCAQWIASSSSERTDALAAQLGQHGKLGDMGFVVNQFDADESDRRAADSEDDCCPRTLVLVFVGKWTEINRVQ